MPIYPEGLGIQNLSRSKSLSWLCFQLVLVTVTLCCLLQAIATPVSAQPELTLVPPEALDAELHTSPAVLESQDTFSEFITKSTMESQAVLTESNYTPDSSLKLTENWLSPDVRPVRGPDLGVNGRVDLMQSWQIEERGTSSSPVANVQPLNQSSSPTAVPPTPQEEQLTDVRLLEETDYDFGEPTPTIPELDKLSRAVSTTTATEPAIAAPVLAKIEVTVVTPETSDDRGTTPSLESQDKFSEFTPPLAVETQASPQEFRYSPDNRLELAPNWLSADVTSRVELGVNGRIDLVQSWQMEQSSISTTVTKTATAALTPSQNLAPLPVPRLVPGSNSQILRSNELPFGSQANLEEIVTLAEEQTTAQISPPRYIPEVPLEAPTPPESETQEAPASPLPPNVPREVGQKILDIIIENLLDNGAGKYPFIINTSDLLTINPASYTPSKFNTYLNFALDLDDFSSLNPITEEAFSDPVLKNLSASVYPDDQQFYWILSGNRVVIETNGAHFNTGYQGIVFSRAIQQRASSTFSLFGQQAVWALPQTLGSLTGTEGADNLKILSGVAQIVLPSNLTLDPDLQVNFTLNNFDGQGNNFNKIVRFDDVNKANTSDLEGGGAFFTNLDADNAPRFLQAFPTVNIQALLNNGVQFRRGETVPLENFQAMGITVGEFFSGQGFRFNNPLASAPGIKTLQLNASDNNDLVKLLSSPFLTDRERDYYYLNSLMWNSGGQQPATVENIELSQSSEDWYRLTFSWSNNRTLLEYHPEEIQLKYTNVFANPGLSLTYTDLSNIDDRQTLNASLGLAFGGLFYLLNPNHLNNHLDEARQHYTEARSMATLKTQATSQERRAMNFRLNRTLQNASSNSGLSQVSGSYTFHGDITPQDSSLMQIKSGVYARAVSFFSQTITDWSEAPITISSVRPSDFGPLIFAGVNVPIGLTSIDYDPVFTLGFVTVQDEGGQLILEDSIRLDRSVLTAIPIIGGKAVDIDFGRISFRQTIDRLITTSNYQGYLYLPALEFALAGTSGDISYSVALGSWFNLYPQSAPGITENFAPPNSSISKEKALGLYFKAFVKGDFTNIFFDDQNQWETILTHTPSLSLNAGANPNRLNISSIGLSYTLQLLRREYNGSVTFSTSYSPQGLNAEFAPNSLGKIGLFTALNFYHQSGFRFSGSLSLGSTSFYALEATYDILQSAEWGVLGIGPYYANYVVATRGFDSQVADSNYGLVINYTLPSSGFSLRAKLGNSEMGFRGDLSVNGQIKF